MITDGILGAVQMIIDRFKTSDEIYAGKIIWDMLSDYDEDEWRSMSDDQKKEWIVRYIRIKLREYLVYFDGMCYAINCNIISILLSLIGGK